MSASPEAVSARPAERPPAWENLLYTLKAGPAARQRHGGNPGTGLTLHARPTPEVRPLRSPIAGDAARPSGGESGRQRTLRLGVGRRRPGPTDPPGEGAARGWFDRSGFALGSAFGHAGCVLGAPALGRRSARWPAPTRTCTTARSTTTPIIYNNSPNTE